MRWWSRSATTRNTDGASNTREAGGMAWWLWCHSPTANCPHTPTRMSAERADPNAGGGVTHSYMAFYFWAGFDTHLHANRRLLGLDQDQETTTTPATTTNYCGDFGGDRPSKPWAKLSGQARGQPDRSWPPLANTRWQSWPGGGCAESDCENLQFPVLQSPRCHTQTQTLGDKGT